MTNGQYFLSFNAMLSYDQIMITVRHYMLDAGWGQSELAKALNVTVSHVSLILNGKRKPSIEIFQKLNHVTGISLEVLLKEAGKKPPRKRPIQKINGNAL